MFLFSPGFHSFFYITTLRSEARFYLLCMYISQSTRSTLYMYWLLHVTCYKYHPLNHHHHILFIVYLVFYKIEYLMMVSYDYHIIHI